MPQWMRRRRLGSQRSRPVVEGLETRSLMAVTFNLYFTPTVNSQPAGITVGPDNNLWYAEKGARAIGELNPSTITISEYALPVTITGPNGITTGPDGNVWFTSDQGIATITATPTHAVTLVGPGSNFSGPIAVGPDNNLWFSAGGSGNQIEIGEISPSTHVVGTFAIPVASSAAGWQITGITAGPDGDVWFSYQSTSGAIGGVGFINPSPHLGLTFATTNPADSITAGSDGKLYFTNLSNIGAINPTDDSITYHPTGIAPSVPAGLNDFQSITTGSDGNIWFSSPNKAGSSPLIGVLNTATGGVSLFPVRTEPAGLVKGPDGNIWFSGYTTAQVGVARIQPYNAVGGQVFLDLSASGTPTAADPPLAGRTVFLDLNHDGKLDPGDPSTTTDARGNYTLTASAFGTYLVRVLAYPGDTVTGTAALGYSVTLAQGTVTPNFNFGIVTAGAITPLKPNPAPFGTHNPNLATAEVNGLYKTILGRVPDSVGLATWVPYLQNGGSLAAVATGFLNSVEYESNLVASYFREFLGRAGSTADINTWVQAMQAGRPPEVVASQFLNSGEFSQLHATNSDFVQALYNDILGRQAAPAEISSWTTAMSSGLTRAGVIQGIQGSAEAAGRSVDGFYTTFMARLADPGGRSTWVNAILNGTPLYYVISAFASSPEYVAHANATVG